METLSRYVLSVICVCLICGILTDLTGKTGSSKLVRLVCSIFLALTLVRPLLALRLPAWETEKNQFFMDAENAAEQGEKIRLQSIRAIIRQESEAYILKEAKSIGAELEVEVELDMSDPPVPCSVTLRGTFDADAESALGKAIEDEFGIPKERQTWIRLENHFSDCSLPNINTDLLS